MNWCKNPTFKEVGVFGLAIISFCGEKQVMRSHQGGFNLHICRPLLPQQAPPTPSIYRNQTPPMANQEGFTTPDSNQKAFLNQLKRRFTNPSGRKRVVYTPPIPWRGYFWTWSIRSVGTPPELHNPPGENSMGKIVYIGHSFLGKTVLRSSTDFTQRSGWTILNQKQVTFGIIQNHKNEWFR